MGNASRARLPRWVDTAINTTPVDTAISLGIAPIASGWEADGMRVGQTSTAETPMTAYMAPHIIESRCKPMDRIREAAAYDIDMDKVLL